MMTALLGDAAIPTVAIYSGLMALRTRVDALRAAAQWTICKEHYDVLEALISITQRSAKNRDRFAHHIWTYTQSLPDDLLLIDPRDMLQSFTVGIGRMLKGETIEGRSFSPEDIQIPPDKIFVYRCKDLEEIAVEFQCLVSWLMIFNEMVIREDDVSRQHKLYRALLAQADIDAALNKARRS